MYLKKLARRPATLAFRLTVWYALIFTLSSFGAFLLFSLLIASGLRERTDQELTAEVTELSSHLALKGLEVVELDINQDTQSSGVDRMFMRVLSPKGEELISTNMAAWDNMDISTAALNRLATNGGQVFETVSIPGKPYKVRVLYGIIGPGKIVQIGKSLEDDERFAEASRERFFVIAAALMIFGGLIGWIMARRALWGIEEVTKTAMNISAGDMGKRVPLKSRGAEVDRLAITFNDMLDRIHGLISGMREMTDNIAHDLKSPITRIRGIAEMTLTGSNSTEQYQNMAASTVEECDRLLEVIETMLDISELEVGAGNLGRLEVDLVRVVEEACELFQPLFEDKGQSVVTEFPHSCPIYGDIQRIQRMVANLLDNAIKYTPSRGTITVSIRSDQNQAFLSVNDNGVGIGGADLAKVFERFYRCDPSRSKAGAGLGLSLVMAIARSHGGDVVVNSYPGKGSTFTVSLPRKIPSK